MRRNCKSGAHFPLIYHLYMYNSLYFCKRNREYKYMALPINIEDLLGGLVVEGNRVEYKKECR